MAEFRASGANDLMLSLKELEEIPHEVQYQMLDAGADVLIAAQKNSVRAKGLVKDKKLLNSISAHRKLSKDKYGYFSPSVLVYPEGQHHKYRRRVVTKVYKRSKHGRTYTVGGNLKTVTNAEVGFIQNFGARHRGIRPTSWMDTANEQAAGAVEAAEAAVYDRWLKSKNL